MKQKKTELDGVHVAKIRNKYIYSKFGKSKPNGFHHYLVYTDKYTKKNVAIQTTHLYQKDYIRFKQLKSGAGIKVQLPGFETPSMVKKNFYTEDRNNKPIDFANRNVYVGKKLSGAKAKKIFSFVNRTRNEKKSKG
ncbi:MAG TPA: hypothetical protein DDW30_04455 [Clostridiales bacterium]|nr:hypothetical protein [Clostridiales bacterium]